MQIDWTHFTPWASLAGGILLGLAASAFILINGRILGISGIIGGLLSPRRGDIGWRIAFVLGMLTAPALYYLVAGPVLATVDAGWGTVIAAGLLVGAGTRYSLSRYDGRFDNLLAIYCAQFRKIVREERLLRKRKEPPAPEQAEQAEQAAEAAQQAQGAEQAQQAPQAAPAQAQELIYDK